MREPYWALAFGCLLAACSASRTPTVRDVDASSGSSADGREVPFQEPSSRTAGVTPIDGPSAFLNAPRLHSAALVDAGSNDAAVGGADAAFDADADTGVDVRGSLSKEAIRQVIQSHLDEVQECYRIGLLDRPELDGRVAVKFIISPDGTVQMAAVAMSTLDSAPVEECIVRAVRTWTFPLPDGGGIVIVVVTYPFLLQR